MVTIDAPSVEEARSRVLANIKNDEAAYDRYLVEVDGGFGRMNVDVRELSNGTLQMSPGGISIRHNLQGK